MNFNHSNGRSFDADKKKVDQKLEEYGLKGLMDKMNIATGVLKEAFCLEWRSDGLSLYGSRGNDILQVCAQSLGLGVINFKRFSFELLSPEELYKDSKMITNFVNTGKLGEEDGELNAYLGAFSRNGKKVAREELVLALKEACEFSVNMSKAVDPEEFKKHRKTLSDAPFLKVSKTLQPSDRYNPVSRMTYFTRFNSANFTAESREAMDEVMRANGEKARKSNIFYGFKNKPYVHSCTCEWTLSLDRFSPETEPRYSTYFPDYSSTLKDNGSPVRDHVVPVFVTRAKRRACTEAFGQHPVMFNLLRACALKAEPEPSEGENMPPQQSEYSARIQKELNEEKKALLTKRMPISKSSI